MERGNTDLTYPRVLGVCQFNFQESDQLLNIQIVSGSADPAAVAFGTLTITPHFFSRIRYNLDRKLNKPNWNALQIRGCIELIQNATAAGSAEPDII